jgi:hypothetical protein
MSTSNEPAAATYASTCSRERSAGSAAQTASQAISSSVRPPCVRAVARIHVAKVCASHASARRAAHGASGSTERAIRSSRAWACATSARTCGDSRGIVPR